MQVALVIWQLNDKYTSPNQKISILNEISNIHVTEASQSGKDSVNTIMDVISQIDATTGGVRDLMDGDQVTALAECDCIHIRKSTYYTNYKCWTFYGFECIFKNVKLFDGR